MAEITASMVKELREKTDAPMMECKKALVEAEGNLDKGEELLRIRLGNKAAKSSSRVAAEGVISTHISADGKTGAMVEVNCETDFVAKNDDFLAFANELAKMVVEQHPASVEALMSLPMDGKTVDEVRIALSGKIGENISVRRFERIETNGKLAQYIHGKKSGALVDYVAEDDTLGKDLAMHIVASKPQYIAKEDVPAEQLEKERAICVAQLKESDTPEDKIESKANRTMTKYVADISLKEQPFVKNPKLSIATLLNNKKATINSFTLYIVGEGIEKKSCDFAAEVAAQAAAARNN